MIRPHTRPSRTRRTAEVDHRRSGTGFVHMLSLKNAFRARLPPKLHRQLLHQHHLRDFLQNSIGNSTSTTCNAIYSEGTISLLTLSVTNSFPH